MILIKHASIILAQLDVSVGLGIARYHKKTCRGMINNKKSHFSQATESGSYRKNYKGLQH